MSEPSSPERSTNPVDKAEKPRASWQAQMAFYLSLATAAFSAFQWWNSKREHRINIAMELSRIYERDMPRNLIDAATEELHTDIYVTENNQLQNLKLTDVQFKELRYYAASLEYVAFLANTGKIDPEYPLSNVGLRNVCHCRGSCGSRSATASRRRPI